MNIMCVATPFLRSREELLPLRAAPQRGIRSFYLFYGGLFGFISFYHLIKLSQTISLQPILLLNPQGQVDFLSTNRPSRLKDRIPKELYQSFSVGFDHFVFFLSPSLLTSLLLPEIFWK